MAKKNLLATINETVVVGGGATGTSSVPTPTGGTATLPNSKKQGDALQKVVDPNNTPIEDTPSETNTKPTGDASASNKATIATKPSAASAVQEDVAAMLDGFDLSEEFKAQATTLFEAAVASRIAEERVAIEEEFDAKQVELEESFEAAKTELIEEVSSKVDEYLNYVVKEWMTENKVAVESSLRSELTEDLITSIKAVFEEKHVTLPEEQVDVVEELAARVEELEQQLNATMDQNIALTNAIEENTMKEVFSQVAEGLAMTQTEKFRTLAEGVDFTDAETYAHKLQIVKEQYFGEKKSAPAALIEEREMNDITEEKAPTVTSSSPVANYVSAISRTVKK
jgi:hypothetical protein